MNQKYNTTTINNTMEEELRDFTLVVEFKNIKVIRRFLANLQEESAIYMFISRNPINRLVGKSPILKIGETNNFKRRMKSYFYLNDISTIENNSKRQTAYRVRRYLENHSNMGVSVYFKEFPKEDLKEKESELLKKYLDKHYELPPLNMSAK